MVYSKVNAKDKALAAGKVQPIVFIDGQKRRAHNEHLEALARPVVKFA